MSLTSGRGPLASRPAGVFVPHLSGPFVYVEPFRRRVRGITGDRTLVDSDRVVLVHRPDQPPAYAFPTGDVADELSSAMTDVAEVVGYVSIEWAAVDTWMEEEETVAMHPRNPYHRVDCLASRRWLRVTVGDTVVVDTDATVAVYETALEPRLYVARHQVTRAGVELMPSQTRTYCRYKGDATYWNLFSGGRFIADAAWSYEAPLSESAPIAGFLSFDETRVSVTTDLPGPALLDG